MTATDQAVVAGPVNSDVTTARMCRCGHRITGHGNDGACRRRDSDGKPPCGCRAPEPVYSAPDVVHLAGCSYRELDYWLRLSRLGHLPLTDRADGSGSARWFTGDELDLIRVVVELRRFGLELSRCFEVGQAVIAGGYSITLADIYELSVRLYVPSSQDAKPEPTSQEATAP